MRADADFMVYVAARWPSLVKEAVLLGARPRTRPTRPPTRCPGVAGTGAGRAGRRTSTRWSRRSCCSPCAAGRAPARTAGSQQAEELLVLAPPTLDELRHQESVNNRATLRRAALVAVPLLLVGAGAGVYLGTTGGDRKPAGRRRARERRDLAGGEPGPRRRLVRRRAAPPRPHGAGRRGAPRHDQDRDGVVYGDDEGRVVYVADDGSRAVLGHKDPEVPVAATDETGWAAWVETGGGPDEAGGQGGRHRQRRGVGGGRRGCAGGRRGRRQRLLRRRRGRARAAPGRQPRGPTVTPRDLLDVRSRIRAFQVDEDTIEVVQSYLRRRVPAPGAGRRALAGRQPRGHPAAGHRTRSRSTTPAPAPSSRTAYPTATTWSPSRRAPRLTVTYVVAPAAQSPGRELELRTCELTLATAECAVAARIPNQGGTPVLAR